MHHLVYVLLRRLHVFLVRVCLLRVLVVILLVLASVYNVSRKIIVAVLEGVRSVLHVGKGLFDLVLLLSRGWGVLVFSGAVWLFRGEHVVEVTILVRWGKIPGGRGGWGWSGRSDPGSWMGLGTRAPWWGRDY